MTIELRARHWVLFASLTLIQFFGWWLTLKRAPWGPAVLGFFIHRGWFGLLIPLCWGLGSAFMTTIILAKLIQVCIRKER